MRSLRFVALLCLAAVAVPIAGAPQDPPSSAALDLGQAAVWDPPEGRVPRQDDIQRMILDILDVMVSGAQVAGGQPAPPGTLAFFGRTSRGPAGSGRFGWAPPATSFLLFPFARRQGVTRSTRVHAYLSALGTSTGEAFDLHIVNDGTAPVRIGGDGVVVEPVRKGADAQYRAGIQLAAARQTGVQSVKANAYCLEYKLKPPDNGTIFRVVDPGTQAKYGPAREILRSARKLQEGNRLQPDSAGDYFHSIRQWAIWVDEQKFTVAKYRDAFVDRTKKNLEAVGQKWSKQAEDLVKSLVPHRWEEISLILREARRPVPGQ